MNSGKDKKKKIVFIEPYVYTNRNTKEYLFLNTLDGRKIIINNPSSKLKRLLNELFNNNFVASINGNILSFLDIKNFISEIREKYIGDIIDQGGENVPVQFSPIINIQEAKTFNGWNIEKNLLGNINSLEISLNNNSKKKLSSLRIIENYIRNPGKILYEINIELLSELLDLSKYHSYWDINIVGANIFKYTWLKNIFNQIIDLENRINYSVPFSKENYNYFNNNKNIYNLKNTKFFFLHKDLNSQIKLIKDKQLHLNIIIDDFCNIEPIEQLLDAFKLFNFTFYPSSIYIQKSSNVEYTKEELFNNTQDMEKILLKGEVNPLLYGKLYIREDSAVYSNIYKDKLGKLSKDSFKEIIRIEIENRRNWFETRQDAKPCKNCLFNLICPPISQFEWELNQFDNCLFYE